MKRLLIALLIIPTLLLAQDKQKETTEKTKVDAWSGATKKNKQEVKFTGYISGKVKDTDNKKALEFATVSLTHKKTNKLIEGTITDNKGRFLFEGINVGEYIIGISFIGFENKQIEVKTSKSKPDFKDNNITLNQNSKLLGEINIEEKKAIYETRIDKIIYNAEHDLNDSENDATDVLRKAPLLSVDLDGNVSLRGSKNIKFLVNGKQSSFFSSDVATALQMIPADQIKSVEVITSPGAKYDGEGDAGIVNIITKKTIIDGYQATTSGSVGDKVNRLSANLKLGKGRFGLSARGGSHFSWPGRVGTNSYERYDWSGITDSGDTLDLNTLKQTGSSENYYNGYRGNISAFYDLNVYNSINSSFSFGGRTMPFIDTMKVVYESYDSTYSSINLTNKTDNTLNMEWTTDYTKTFANNEDRKLSFAFQVGGDLNDGNTKIDESGTLTFNQNDEKTMEETFQVDYTHPIRKNKLEIGAKIINRDREMVYSDSSNIGYSNADIFNYNQLVPSSYISTEINLPFGLGLKTGLRYEQTNVSGNWKTDKTPRFDTTYYNLLPNLVLSKSFSPMRSIKFSYNNRITRPGVRHINPNSNSVDSRNVTIGNPSLIPTLTEQFEIGINSFGKITQGSYQVYYKRSTDVIETFLEVEDDISTSTYRNIGETKQYGASYFGSIRLSKFTFRGSINLYQYIGRDASLGFNDWTDPVLLYSYHMGGNVDLGNNWKAETFGFFRSPTQTIQGSSTTFSMMSFGIKKTFKNKRGSLGLRVIEPFKKDKVFTTDLAGENFSQVSTRSIPFRSFGISFKYTFGKLNFKSSNKKTSIKNDDIKEESSGEF